MIVKGICRKLALILTGLCISVICYSQDDKDKTEDKGDLQVPDQLTPVPPPAQEIFYQGCLQGGGGIIYPITNKALRMSLQGVYYLHFSTSYVIRQHLFAGLELENNQLGITGNVSAFNTSMFTYSVGAKIGYYSYMQRDFLISYSVSGGMSYIKFSSTPNSPPKGGFHYYSPFVTPNIFVGYRVNNELRIGLEFSYLFNFYTYDPYAIGIAQYIDPSPSDVRGISTSFSWGFGVYEAFAEKKTIAPPKQE